MRKTISFLRGMVTNGILTGQPWTTQGVDPKECDGKWMVLAMSGNAESSWSYLEDNPSTGFFEAKLDLPSKKNVHIMLYCEGVNCSEDDKKIKDQYGKIKQETGNAVTDEQLDQCFAPKNMIPFGGIYINTDHLSQSKETASIVHMREDIYCMLSSPDHFSVKDNEKKTEMIENKLTKLSDELEDILADHQARKQAVLEKMCGKDIASKLWNMISSVNFSENSAASWGQGSGVKLSPSVYEDITNARLNNTIHRDAVNALQGMVESMVNRGVCIKSISMKRLFEEWDKHTSHKVSTDYNYTFDETEMPPPGMKLDPEKKVIIGDQAKAGAGYYLASLRHMESKMSMSIAAIADLQRRNAEWNSDALKQHLSHCVWMLVSKSEQDINMDCEDQADKQKALLRTFFDKELIQKEINARKVKPDLKKKLLLVTKMIQDNIEITDVGIKTGDGSTVATALVLASGAKLDGPQLPGAESQKFDKSDVVEVMNRSPSLGGHAQCERMRPCNEKFDSEHKVKIWSIEHIQDNEGTGGTVCKQTELDMSSTLKTKVKLQVVASVASCASLETMGKVEMLNKALAKCCIQGNPEKIICTMTQITAQLALSNVPNIKLVQFTDKADDNFTKLICNWCGNTVISQNKKGEFQVDASNMIDHSILMILVAEKDQKYWNLIDKFRGLFEKTYTTRANHDELQATMLQEMKKAGIDTKIPKYTNTDKRGKNAWDEWSTENIRGDFVVQESPFITNEEVAERICKSSSLSPSHVVVIPGPCCGPRGYVLSRRIIITS